MSDLRVKNVVAHHVVLVDEGGLVLTEIVKDLHDAFRFHDFLEPVLKGIDSQ